MEKFKINYFAFQSDNKLDTKKTHILIHHILLIENINKKRK